MNPFDDLERFSETLDRVEPYEADSAYYEIKFDGWTTGIKSPDIEPKVGDTITFWGHRYGIRRGFALNGVVVEYMTKEEQDAKWEKEKREREEAQRAAYERSRPEYNERIAKLPSVFQDRIQLFRETNSNWGWNYESYELFCCEEAVKLAEHFTTPGALEDFWKSEAEEQDEVYTASDQHSGNTWGASLRLAYTYLTEPDTVPHIHGAMCGLVGCKDYGCHAARLIGKTDV